jgi:hypothetical protein
MRWIRFALLLAVLVAPTAGRAMTTDVEQKGSWTLRTSTAGALTKDYFCVNDANFARGYQLMMARNLLGQSSLIFVWPEFKGANGTLVPLRIGIEQKALRDLQAVVKGPGMLVAALGWDDAAMQDLSRAKRITVTGSQVNVRYNVKGNESSFDRLNSCGASLLDRLPDTAGLSAEVRKVLRTADLSHARQVRVASDNRNLDHFMIDGIFGGSATLPGDGKDISQRMLDYIDRLELLCKSRFSSELGAPSPIPGGEMITAEAKCDSRASGTVTPIVIASQNGKARVFFYETEKNRAAQARTLRDLTLRGLKSDAE